MARNDCSAQRTLGSRPHLLSQRAYALPRSKSAPREQGRTPSASGGRGDKLQALTIAFGVYGNASPIRLTRQIIRGLSEIVQSAYM